ncbi:hypothetical protein [Salinibacter altiplanensis]|uniref:hypothetical protein n=1 Tax=Salinibacter altiplanensis TaxID=1803181 RepID=UPI000C9FAE53|nr:hypothetical protein [Salinibacter altiplanensis]
MKATKREWVQRLRTIDQLDYGVLPDVLISALWDAVEKIKPLDRAVDGTRASLAKKYAWTKDGQAQTLQSVRRRVQENMGSEVGETTGRSEGEVQEAGQEAVQERVRELTAEYLQVQVREETTILVEDTEAFREAMEDILEETVALDVETVPLREAVTSGVPMGDLQEVAGWIIERKPAGSAAE